MKQSHKTLLLWVVLIVMFLTIWNFLTPAERKVPVAFSDFVNEVHAGRVDEIRIKDREYTYRIKGADPTKGGGTKEAVGPLPDEKLLETLKPTDPAAQTPKVFFEKEDQSPFWSSTIITLIPMAFLILMFFLFMRQLQAGGGKAMSFGKSKARMLSDSQNKVTFADVAGVEEAKDEVEEIIAFLKDPKKFQRLGGRIPKGVLMIGPPGTGKTLLARAIAGEAGVPFFSISGSDFVEMFVGVGASRVRDLFEQGKKHAPCIIFIDEIDAVGRHRGAGLGGGHDEREQTLNQLLVEMDGFESNDGVIIIAATNRPDVLDPAILRPGRFDRRITVNRPDVRGREAILRVHTKRVPLSGDVEMEVIARGTPGFAGADLENLVNEAALLAARQDKDAVSMADFELAKDKVLMGSERRSMVMTEEEKWNTAVHEAGHAVMMIANEHHDPVHKVTIIPRGRALGVTMPLPKGDILGRTKEQFEAQIQSALGGRIAEEVFFGKLTTGASNDIRQLTQIARAMVSEYGMSEKLGPIAYGGEEGSIFLGRDYTQRGQDYSEQTAREIDQEVRALIQTQYDIVKTLLTEKRDRVESIAKNLLEHETLDAEDLKAIFEGRELPPRTKVIIPTYAEKERAKQEKRKAASIFGGPPKPATS
ncbi:Cell division protein FtsH [Labilithrix luteola]|uniref:ATP-dependent zinc metalloprotease FtsH n=1 Tax=Labilithrix luteola TaxID=1391654 RepID=A0A0K1Q4S5_9BACT|nr:ATP-dependent zinc metalloprotease FtsH [Labilithrix luteola]AKV00831.1 Cell division protein FtsH [Labilithrix luteola]